MTAAPHQEPVPHPFDRAMLTGLHQIELILVRHGQQIPSHERVGDQKKNPPLTDLGECQIEAVADYLAGEDLTAIYSSNLERAHRTGLAIAARHGFDVTVDPELREIEIMRDLPKDTKPQDAIAPDVWKESGDAFMATRRWDSFPLSETGDELRARVDPAVDRVVAAHDTGRIVIACHGGVINAIFGSQLGLETDFFFRPAHCSVHRMLIGDDRRVLQTLNEVTHLSDGLETY